MTFWKRQKLWRLQRPKAAEDWGAGRREQINSDVVILYHVTMVATHLSNLEKGH